jgi:hypothetical protein
MLTTVLLAATMVVGQAPEPVSHYEHLKFLECSIGSWQAANDFQGDTYEISLTREWQSNKNAIVQTFVVSKESDVVFSDTGVIGWDPIEKQVVKHGFNFNGDHVTAILSKEGDTLVNEVSFVRPNGTEGKNRVLMSNIKPDSFEFQVIPLDSDGSTKPDQMPVLRFTRLPVE